MPNSKKKPRKKLPYEKKRNNMLSKKRNAERRANSIVSKMMERNSSQPFGNNLPIQNRKSNNNGFRSFKKLVDKRRKSQKKQNNAKARANAQSKALANARANENRIYKQQVSEVFDAMAKNLEQRALNNRNKDLQIYDLYTQYEKHLNYIYHQLGIIENNIAKYHTHQGPFQSVAMDGFIKDLIEACINNAFAITLERDELKQNLNHISKLINLLCILKNLKCNENHNENQPIQIVNTYDIKPPDFRGLPPINNQGDLQYFINNLDYFMNDKVFLMEHLRQNIELLKITSNYLMVINYHIEETYRLVLIELSRR